MKNQSQQNQIHGCNIEGISFGPSLRGKSVQAMHHRTSQSSLCRVAIMFGWR
jgi:hypothetical protein